MVLSNFLLTIKSAQVLTPTAFILHFLFNLAFTWGIIYFLYYRKSKRVDYYFTFLLISSSIFLICYMMSGLKMKMGFALGLFAVFGIMKYRTVQMPVREMTYMFVLVSLALINALGGNLGWGVLFCANILLVILIIISEIIFSNRKGVKYIKYDRIDLCKKSKRKELITDIEDRFELKVINVYIGSINTLKDMALIKVYYELDDDDRVDEEILRFPKE